MHWLRVGLAFLVFTTPAMAGDWPQWLGPNRDGVSADKVAPWKEAPERLWSAPVGQGHSSPIVADGRVYLHHKVEGKNAEELAAFDAATGRKLWGQSYPRADFKSLFGTGPSATPSYFDGKVFTFGITGVLSCFDAASGKLDWQVNTLEAFHAPNLYFGVSCSPLVEGDNVLVSVGTGATIVAFRRANGKVAWESLKEPASYSSPVGFNQANARQAVFVTQKGVVAVNPADGSVYWQYPLVDRLSESSTTPVRVGDLLVASSVTFGSAALNLQEKDGKPAVKEAWKNAVLTCYFATPVPVGSEHLYMVTGSMPPFPQAKLHCVDVKSGKQLWTKEKVGKYHATLLRTGDNRLLLLDDSGNLMLLEPNPQEYRELARAKVCGETWAHPALADGKLYLRDEKELICLRLRP